MKTNETIIFTKDEIEKLHSCVDLDYSKVGVDYKQDFNQQVIIYTGVYEWSDGTWCNNPEPRI